MTSTFVSTSLEAGFLLLKSTSRLLRSSSTVEPRKVGRISYSSLGSSDVRVHIAQSAFLRTVSIVEASIDSLAMELTELHLPLTTETLRLLALEKELASTSNWEARRNAFERHHRIALRKCAGHSKLEGAIEVRNAIAHGLGELTARQLQSDQTMKRLSRLRVGVANNRIDVRRSDVVDCINYSSQFLLAVDGLL